jgi:hypothetical protein
VAKEQGAKAAAGLSEAWHNTHTHTHTHTHTVTRAVQISRVFQDVIYRIEIPANRYDLLCLEGIARAFRSAIGTRAFCDFTLALTCETRANA